MATEPFVDPLAGSQLGTSSSLSPWAAPYVTDMLGKGAALADMPYQGYGGQISAGASGLQNQAFEGLGSLGPNTDISGAAAGAGGIADQAAGMSYGPNTFTSGIFDNAAASQYMSPYLQSSLNPQLDEARRQAEISRMNQAGRLTKAGAYGGSRQAIMESELDRNLQRNLSDITGTGYQDAFTAAQNQFNADQNRGLQAQQYGEQSKQFGAGFGLDALRQQLLARQAQGQLGQGVQGAELERLGALEGAGATQRGIAQEGIAANMRQFEQERDDPYRKVQYMQSLLQGLPIETQDYQYAETSPLSNFFGGASGGLTLWDIISGGFGGGTTPTTTPPG